MIRMMRLRTIDDMGEAKKEIERIGAGKKGIEIMAPKAVYRTIKIDSLDNRMANIIKQEMLSIGGEAALSKDSLMSDSKITDVLLMGTMKQYQILMKKLREQSFNLPNIADEIKNILENIDNFPAAIKFKNYSFDWSRRTYIMGILNITPDSFSGDGLLGNTEDIVEIARNMVRNGADIIDIGGESTRPGAEPVSIDEELNRVIPVIKRISKIKDLDIPISIDTYKPEVAKKAIKSGASIVNDINGLRSEGMAEIVAKEDVPVVIMHMQGTPKDMQRNPTYDSVVEDIMKFFKRQIDYAVDMGVDRNRIILDPGIGFGKTTEHNLEIINRLSEFKSMGLPILLGASRKSFIGNILNLSVTERLEGTIAAITVGIINGANIVRVHDVKEISRAARIADAIKMTRYS